MADYGKNKSFAKSFFANGKKQRSLILNSGSTPITGIFLKKTSRASLFNTKKEKCFTSFDKRTHEMHKICTGL